MDFPGSPAVETPTYKARACAGLVAQPCPTPGDPTTVARRAALSMGLASQECLPGLPSPSPGDRPNSGTHLPASPVSCLGRRFCTAAPLGKPQGSTPAQGPEVLCAAHQGQALRQNNRDKPLLLLLTCKHWPRHRFSGRVPRHGKNINMSLLLAHCFSSVQSLSRVWLFATPWTAARQASLSITHSPSLLKLTSSSR